MGRENAVRQRDIRYVAPNRVRSGIVMAGRTIKPEPLNDWRRRTGRFPGVPFQR